MYVECILFVVLYKLPDRACVHCQLPPPHLLPSQEVCVRYWPETNHPEVFGKYQVEKSAEDRNESTYIIRKFKICSIDNVGGSSPPHPTVKSSSIPSSPAPRQQDDHPIPLFDVAKSCCSRKHKVHCGVD